MADESIIIKIEDRIPKTINTKLSEMSKSAKSANTQLRALNNTISLLNRKQVNLISQTNINRFKNFGDNALYAKQKVNFLNNEVVKLKRNLNNIPKVNLSIPTGGRGGSGGRPSVGLGVGAASVAGAYLALSGVRSLKNMSDEYINLENKIRIVTKSQANLNTIMDDLFNIANRSRSSINAMGILYQRLDMALGPLGKSQKEVLRLTETISKVTTLSGLSVEEQTNSIRQLTQAFNKGKIDGDEFRTMMENMPLLMKAIADEMKVAKDQLLDLAPQGKITADVLVRAIERIEKEVDIKFEKSIMTIDQSFEILRNNAVRMVGEFNKVSKVSNTVANGIVYLASVLYDNRVAIYTNVTAFTNLLEQIIILGNRVSSFVDILKKINPVFIILDKAGKSIADVFNAIGLALAKVSDKLDLVYGKFEKLAGFFQSRANIRNFLLEGISAFDKPEQTPLMKKGQNRIDKAKELKNELGLIDKLIEQKKTITELEKAINNKTYEQRTHQERMKQLEKSRLEMLERRSTLLDNIKENLKISTRYFGMPAQERKINEQIDKLDLKLKSVGSLKPAEKKELKGLMKETQSLLELMGEMDKIYETNEGRIKAIDTQIKALNLSFINGNIIFENYQKSLTELVLAKRAVTDSAARYRYELTQEINLLSELREKDKGEVDLLRTIFELKQKKGTVEEIDIKNIEEQLNRKAVLNEILQIENRELNRQYEFKIKIQAINESLISQEEKMYEMKKLLPSSITQGTSFDSPISSIMEQYDHEKGKIKHSVKTLGISKEDEMIMAENLRQKTLKDALPEMFDDKFFDSAIKKWDVYHEKIIQLRRENLLSEKEYQKAILKLDEQKAVEKLKIGQEIFGNLSSLMSSGNKELFHIGRASAIAEATIAGILAVQKALSSAPPPLNYALAASVGIATALNVSKIAQTPPPQYAVGGLVPGERKLISVNERGPEFIVNAQATRKHRALLERINANPNNPPVGIGNNVSINIENYNNSAIEVRKDNDDKIRIIVREEIDTSVPMLVSNEINNPNSRISKSMSANLNLQRSL